MYSDGDGRFTGTEAVKFFAMSNLSRQDLKQVLYFINLFYAQEKEETLIRTIYLWIKIKDKTFFKKNCF